MANEMNRITNSITASQKRIGRIDRKLAREIVSAYQSARRELLAYLADGYAQLGTQPSPAQIRSLLTRAGLIDAIDSRMAEMQQELILVLDENLRMATDASYQAIASEIEILAHSLEVGTLMPFAIDPLLELTVAPALDQVPGLVSAVRSQLRGSLRSSLAQGQRMEEISRALYGVNNSIFSRGMTSARLMGHRAVTEAENVARLAYLDHAKGQIPQLKKQAIARIDSRTSETCLNVHGQIQEIDKPFNTDGKEAFAPQQMAPPFHWGPCRTSVTAYHPIFEQSSKLTTSDLTEEAQTEMASRK